jgi:cell division inhibitor SulA
VKLQLRLSSDRSRLQSLVDALPDTEVPVAISFLAELGEREIIDAETAAKLDLARAEPGDDVPLEEVRHRLGL